jgi:hypothetical protein
MEHDHIDRRNMINFIQHFMDFFNNPEEKKENKEEVRSGENQALDAQARTQLKKKKETKKSVSYTF